MIETNTITGEQKVFCDECSTPLEDEFIVFTNGTVQCKSCFEKSHKTMTVEEYLKPEVV